MSDSSMNANTKLDPSNLNTSGDLIQQQQQMADGGVGGGQAGAAEVSARSSQASGGGGDDAANLEYLKGLAGALGGGGGQQQAQGGDGNNFSMNHGFGGGLQGIGGGGGMMMLPNGFNGGGNGNGNGGGFPSDTDTVTTGYTSGYNSRRVSKDSLVSRDSLTDMLNADSIASSNLAVMSMLQQQQQGQGGGGGMGNQSFGLGGLQGQGQGLGAASQQSMAQLLSGMTSMGNNNNAGVGGGGWNNNPSDPSAGGNGGGGNPLLANAYGLDGGGLNNGGNNVNLNNGIPSFLVPPRKTKSKHKQTFAQKLMHVLSVKECQGAIRWMPNGCAFCVVDSKELVESVLPKYFKEAKYTSFVSFLSLVCFCVWRV